MSKLGIVAAFAIGYVAGASAGRERYEQIVAGARQFVGSMSQASGQERLRDARGRFVSTRSTT